MQRYFLKINLNFKSKGPKGKPGKGGQYGGDDYDNDDYDSYEPDDYKLPTKTFEPVLTKYI